MHRVLSATAGCSRAEHQGAFRCSWEAVNTHPGEGLAPSLPPTPVTCAGRTPVVKSHHAGWWLSRDDLGTH